MKLSVIVPVYKTEKYLEKCVDSLANQTFKDMEVILIDDGSPDSCPAICDNYARKFPNIRVIHQANGGHMSARKAGLALAEGEYVTFLDSDDWVAFDYYQRIFDEVGEICPQMIRAPRYYEVLACKEPVFHETFHAAGCYDRGGIERDILPIILSDGPFYSDGILPTLWSLFFKKSVFESLFRSIPNGILVGEDTAFSVLATLQAKDVFIVKACGYFYRQNPSSITHVYTSSKVVSIIALLDFLGKSIGPSAPFDLRYQLSTYAVYLAYVQSISMVLFSQNLSRDSMEIKGLLSHPIVREGLKIKGIPLKTRLVLKNVAKGNIFYLKILKVLWRNKSGEKKGGYE